MSSSPERPWRPRVDPGNLGDHGVTNFDVATGVLTFRCERCDQAHEYPAAEMSIQKKDPADRRVWALTLGPCPACLAAGRQVTHHLNLAMPADHPHPCAKHIERLLVHLHPGRQLPAVKTP